MDWLFPIEVLRIVGGVGWRRPKGIVWINVIKNIMDAGWRQPAAVKHWFGCFNGQGLGEGVGGITFNYLRDEVVPNRQGGQDADAARFHWLTIGVAGPNRDSEVGRVAKCPSVAIIIGRAGFEGNLVTWDLNQIKATLKESGFIFNVAKNFIQHSDGLAVDDPGQAWFVLVDDVVLGVSDFFN